MVQIKVNNSWVDLMGGGISTINLLSTLISEWTKTLSSMNFSINQNYLSMYIDRGTGNQYAIHNKTIPIRQNTHLSFTGYVITGSGCTAAIDISKDKNTWNRIFACTPTSTDKKVISGSIPLADYSGDDYYIRLALHVNSSYGAEIHLDTFKFENK